MNDNLPAPTHTAWVLFVPVFIAMSGEDYTPDCPGIWSRHIWMERLLPVALALQNVFFGHFFFWRVRAIA